MNDRVVKLVLALLARATPAADRDEIVSDLHDEWCEIVAPERGPAAARTWLVYQVVASIPPLLVLRIRRAAMRPVDAVAVGATAVIAAFAVQLAGDAAWHAVLSQVPMRASHAPGLPWIAAQLTAAAAAALITGALAARWMATNRRASS